MIKMCVSEVSNNGFRKQGMPIRVSKISIQTLHIEGGHTLGVSPGVFRARETKVNKIAIIQTCMKLGNMTSRRSIIPFVLTRNNIIKVPHHNLGKVMKIINNRKINP